MLHVGAARVGSDPFDVAGVAIFRHPGDDLEGVVPAPLHRQSELSVLLNGEGGVDVLDTEDAILILDERGLDLARPEGSFGFLGTVAGDALATALNAAFEVAVALVGLAEIGPEVRAVIKEGHFL